MRLRDELLRRTRAFFHARGFIEVETPILSHDVVVDRHLDPLAVTVPDDPRNPQVGRRLWLQTSPEFGMKRLLAAGGEAIFQITRAFRGAEQGTLHNPEFTMVEWYRRGDDYSSGMQLLSDLAESLLARGAAERITYADAFAKHVFAQHAGADVHHATIAELASAVQTHGIVLPAGMGDEPERWRDLWLDLLLTECVQPRLGIARPAILYDFPASQAALAQVRPGDPPVAERFELYVDGIELANGYHELLDAQVLRARNAAANVQRRADGKPALPEESRLLAAMDAGLPASTGVALGFDRVVMLAAGAKTLAEVIAFPFDRA